MGLFRRHSSFRRSITCVLLPGWTSASGGRRPRDGTPFQDYLFQLGTQVVKWDNGILQPTPKPARNIFIIRLVEVLEVLEVLNKSPRLSPQSTEVQDGASARSGAVVRKGLKEGKGRRQELAVQVTMDLGLPLNGFSLAPAQIRRRRGIGMGQCDRNRSRQTCLGRFITDENASSRLYSVKSNPSTDSPSLHILSQEAGKLVAVIGDEVRG